MPLSQQPTESNYKEKRIVSDEGLNAALAATERIWEQFDVTPYLECLNAVLAATERINGIINGL